MVPASVYKLHLNTKEEKIYTWKEQFTKLNEGPYEERIRRVDDSNPRPTDLYYKIKSDEQRQEDFDVIRHMKIGLFDLALGVNGLAVLWKMLALIDAEPFDVVSSDIWKGIAYIGAVLFCTMLLLYGLKLALYPKKVYKEWLCNLRSNQFASISINLLLSAYLVDGKKQASNDFATTIFWFASVVQIVLSTILVQSWLQRRISDDFVDVSFMYAPLGNFVVALIGPNIDPGLERYMWFWFSSGFIMLVLLLPVTFEKVITNSNSDDRRRNTLLIWAASCSIASLALATINEEYEDFSTILYWSGVFLFLVFCQGGLMKFIGRAKFDISYYALGFPSVVVAMSSLSYTVSFSTGADAGDKVSRVVTYILIAFANLCVVVNLLHTFTGLLRRHILRPTIPRWAPLSFMKLTHEGFHGFLPYFQTLCDDLVNNFTESQLDYVIEEYNIFCKIHEIHSLHEDEVIFKEFRICFPGFTDEADKQHEEHHEMLPQISNELAAVKGMDSLENKKDQFINEVLPKIKTLCKEMKDHLALEEAHLQPIGRKYLPVDLMKDILRRVWEVTPENDWKIFFPWVLRHQTKHMQRVLFLKTFTWSLPYRCQQIGLIVYNGINDVLWSQISNEIPEIIPRGLPGWKRHW